MRALRRIPVAVPAPAPTSCALTSLDYPRAHGLCTLLDVVDALVCVVDRDGSVVLFNHACESATGFSADEVCRKKGIDLLVPPEKRREVARLVKHLFDGGDDNRNVNEWLTKDGRRRMISWSNTAIRDADGNVRHVIGTGIDVTEQREAQAALRESEQNFRLLVESVTDYAIFTVDPDATVRTWNSGAERIYGYGAEEIIGRGAACLRVPEERGEPARKEQLAEATRRRVEVEGWRLRKDGRRFWAHVIRTPVLDDDGRVRGIASVTRDITERRELERQVIEASAEEQRRIGQDLHDGLCQELTGVAFACQALINDLEPVAPRQADRLRKIADLVDHAISDARALSHGLQPVSVEPDGLSNALRRLADQVQEMSGVSCLATSGGRIGLTDAAVTTHLFRITQEAVNNAVRHGHARRIRIRLWRAGTTVHLVVSDDGVGMEPDPGPDAGPAVPRGDGMGLSIMRYRANLIGATLDIRSERQRGTSVLCSVSCEEKP